ncbi:hypothetical protein EBESD8_6580 [Rhodococcus aetherivorans]|nr:hypothetical protein EBESD8_6580 [Rhodococcus aetherivorans]
MREGWWASAPIDAPFRTETTVGTREDVRFPAPRDGRSTCPSARAHAGTVAQ